MGVQRTRNRVEQDDHGAHLEEEERESIGRSLAALEQATGQAPVGWVGADYGESSRTVCLLAELEVRYVCDWPSEEQPYRMSVPKEEMVEWPVAVELDEVFAHRERFISTSRWAQMVIEALNRLREDGAASGHLLALNLHPWIIGQPFRSKYLKHALRHIVQRTVYGLRPETRSSTRTSSTRRRSQI